MWLGRDPAIIRDPACIAYLIYTAPASKQDPALIWTRLINGHIRYIYTHRTTTVTLAAHARRGLIIRDDYCSNNFIKRSTAYAYAKNGKHEIVAESS